ncbi:serine/threonine-protein kinase [Nocardia stercoris]|nr:serine/threonine-protein kinase [Nocardia stercoris]
MQSMGAGDQRTAGRYALLAVIGAGAMGRVLLGRAPEGRFVAIKQIHAHLARDPELRARFRREVEASRMVTGAYTAGVLDADPDAEVPWLASEFVPGPSLRELVDQEGPLPLRGQWLLATGLAAALSAIHRAGLIHRDLKPGNVLLATDGPRVIDFGIARAATESADLTGTGTVIGSPAYMSPEQAEGRELTPASDVFSLGAILIMAATGESPFVAASTAQSLYRVLHSNPDLSGVPEPLRAVTQACLAKDPAERPTATQLLDHLSARRTVDPGWPAAVHEMIVHRRAAAETAAAAAATGEDPARIAPVRSGKRLRWAEIGTAAGGVAAVAIAVAALIVGMRPVQGTAVAGTEPLRIALTADSLRTVDACGLMTDAIPRTTGLVKRTNSRRTWANCTTQYDGPNGGVNATLRLAELDVPSHLPEAARVAGAPVYEQPDPNDSEKCTESARVLDNPKAVVQLTASVSGAAGCPTTMAMLKGTIERMAVAAPHSGNPTGSFLSLDPCSMLRPADVAAAIGEPAPPAMATALHRCVAEGRTVSVTLDFGDIDDVKSENGVTDTEVHYGNHGGDGTVRSLPTPPGVTPMCFRQGRRYGDKTDRESVAVTVRAQPGATVDWATACTEVDFLYNAIDPRLPQ